MKGLMTLPHTPRWPEEEKGKQGRRGKGGEDKSGNGRTGDNFYY